LTETRHTPHATPHTPLWGGRFAAPLDARALAFTSSLGVDRRLFALDVLGSIAHARMLGRTGIVPATEADVIVAGLRELLLDPPSLDGGYEDVHSLVEATLTERIGAAAGRLHTARSRNDQIATDSRLWARGALVDGVAGLAELIEALLGAVARQGETVMPGYTHLQRAQRTSCHSAPAPGPGCLIRSIATSSRDCSASAP
jgi:argininosuccinate lyase